MIGKRRGRAVRELEITILRRTPGGTESRFQTFLYTPAGPGETVASALQALNEREELLDSEGNAADPIRWECSCLQKKCGACAMVINGRPGLACDARLSSLGRSIRLEPLRKFPVIADLIVDRSTLFRNLDELKVWLHGREEGLLPWGEEANRTAYEASRCLQCGCCLEICPNFCVEGGFAGMAAAMPLSRILAELSKGEAGEASADYRKRIYEGCGKSLACRDICPAGIPIDEILARSNAAAVWGRPGRRGKS